MLWKNLYHRVSQPDHIWYQELIDSGNASMTVYKTNEHLSSFQLDVVDNNHLLAYRLNHI